MIILIDQDGVLSDFETHFYNEFRARFPNEVAVHPKDRKSYYVDDDYPERLANAVSSIPTMLGFYRNMPPILGAVEGVTALVNAGHDVRICTAPLRLYDNCVKEKYDWVNQHLGSGFTDRMMLTRDKTLVHGDILIDDKPVIEGVGPRSWRHIAFGQPYNTQCVDRIEGWDRVVSTLCS